MEEFPAHARSLICLYNRKDCNAASRSRDIEPPIYQGNVSTRQPTLVMTEILAGCSAITTIEMMAARPGCLIFGCAHLGNGARVQKEKRPGLCRHKRFLHETGPSEDCRDGLYAYTPASATGTGAP